MNDFSSGIDVATLVILIGIWLVVFLGFYIWWAWSLARLFKRIGVKPAYGWIPIVNMWQLINRGGGPGWTVLFGLIGLGVVPFIFTIVAIHRINTEYGRGGGLTFLGVILQPIWAMVLANHIDRTGSAYPAARPVGAAAPASQRTLAPVPGQPAQYPGSAGSYLPDRSAPGMGGGAQYAPPSGAASPQRQGTFPQPAGVPPMPGGISSGGGSAHPAATEHSAPSASRNHLLGPSEPQRPFAWPGTEGSTAGQASTVMPAAPAPASAHAPTQTPAPAPAPTNAPAPAPAPNPVPAPVTGPVTGPATGPAPAPAQPSRAATFASPVPASQQTPPAPSQPVSQPAPADEVSDVQPQPSSTPTSDPAHARPEPPRGTEAQAESSEPVAMPAQPTQSADPQPAPTPSERGGATPATLPEPEDDHTVVVRHSSWGLELPDGEFVAFESDDVVVGRRPAGIGDSTAAAVIDETKTLSKSHARFRRTQAGWSVEDLGSTNGVAMTDEQGARHRIESGREYEVSERLVLGTLEVRLVERELQP